MYGPKQEAFHAHLEELRSAEPLGQDRLKDLFFEKEIPEWIAFRHPSGKLAVEPTGKTGLHNAERAVKGGGKIIGRCRNVSRNAALAEAARLSQEEQGRV